MRTCLHRAAFFLFLILFSSALCAPRAGAQSIGNAGSITGTVTDPSGAVVPGAVVTIQNPVSQYLRNVTTDSAGHFQFTNVPFNPYHMTVTKTGFAGFVRDVDVRSGVPVTVPVKLVVGTASETVQVTGEDLIENDPTFHTDVDRDLFQTIPLESQSSSLSSLVTLSSPGVAADSNGLFHGLGDHASNSFSIDGQSITDQQSKVFSNQLPTNAVQSLEVISGAPPAEYGDKTSLIIVATTRSGQGITTPTGDIYASYGSFGSANGGFDLSYGSKGWGNFIEGDGLNTGRFLDPPEFAVFHDKGNEENFFDRIDRTFTSTDSIHVDLNYSRSWFQTPNSFDNLNVQNVVSGGASANPTFANVGNADQRSKINTFNISPTYTRMTSPNSVLNFGAWVRKDFYNYYPSGNPLADEGAPNEQTSSISQNRTLTNVAGHADWSYVKGINNVKIGVEYEQTFLREHDDLGIVEPTYSFSAPCVDNSGNPLAGFSYQDYLNNCTAAPSGASANPNYAVALDGPSGNYDLTRGGAEYAWFGHTDVKQLETYVEDIIKVGNWSMNLGLRGDVYNGLADKSEVEPRPGIAYHVKRTNTVLAVSYARTMETPFNENLVLSSEGCANAVLNPLLACNPGLLGILRPGWRNDFHASFEQAFGKRLVVGGEYMWKYTHGAHDFSVLGNTPITFPVDWHNSKIPGFAIHAEVPEMHGFSAYTVMSSVAARFYPPQIGGAGTNTGVSQQTQYPFRIDHDEKYNQTTHLQYQLPGKFSPWYSFNWRFDSGLVAGAVPCYNATSDPNSPCGTFTTPAGQPGVDLSGLTYDEQFEMGLSCDGVKATPYSGFSSCDNAGYKSNLVQIPAPNTENDDHNPPRVAPRNLFDMALGEDNLFHGDKYKWGAQLTAINVTDKYALYNYLSTFSGTHYVTPRAITGRITLSF